MTRAQLPGGVDPPSVFITGTSTGIGHASALALSELGFDVYAGVRRDEDGEALKAAAGSAGKLTPILIDVTDKAAIRRAAATVTGRVGECGLAGLVNNAGVGIPGPLEYLPPAEFRRQLEVNLIGPLQVIQEFLPLVRAARGRIVNVSSVAGKVANIPFNGAYAAAKHGLEAMSDTLRSELRPWGIEVCVIQPGAISTAMPDTFLRTAESVMDGLPDAGKERYGATFKALVLRVTEHCRADGSPPETVAKDVVHALTARSPRPRYPRGAQAGRALRMQRILPGRVFDHISRRLLSLEPG